MVAKYKYHLYLLLAGFSFSSLAIFTAFLTNQGVNVFSQIFFRALFSAVLSGTMAIIVFKQHLVLNSKELRYICINSLIFLGAFTTFSTGIFLGTPVAKAVALNYAYPLTIVLLSYLFFKEFPSIKGWLAIFLSVISVLLILEIWTVSSILTLDTGSLLELVNSIFFGGMIVFSKKINNDLKIHSFKLLVFTFLFVAIIFLIFAAFLTIFGISVYKPSFQILSMESWLSLLGMSFFGNIVPIGLIYISAAKVKSYAAGVLLSTEPLWVYVLGILLFGQNLTIWAALGMIGIIIAVLLV